MSQSGIRDNHQRGSVAGFLREKIKLGSRLSIVSAYFTIYAYAALKDHFDQIESLRFLFGEPRFLQAIDPSKNESKAFRIEEAGLTLSNQISQRRTAQECADWIRQKVEIRSVTRANLMHGKMYHIDTDGRDDAILGSSNFTVSGLGLNGANSNIELNLEVDSRRDREDMLAWFDALWEDEKLVTDVRDEVLGYLDKLYTENTSEFIYYKTLFHLFEQYLNEQEANQIDLGERLLYDTTIWNMLFEFQKDGVKGAINKLLAHNGCIIADSVGLGKTFEALAVIKYFELRNSRILVLCPKKLRENWTVYLSANNSALNPLLEDRFNYTVLSHTDLSRDGGRVGDVDLSTVNWGNYDLVVIDESHNFRNNRKGKRDEEGNVIRKSRYERLMEDIIQSGVQTRVLLLSATPVNNDLRDLRNQIYFMTGNDDTAFADVESSLGVQSVDATLRNAQRVFNEWAEREPRDKRVLLEQLSAAFFKLLDGLTIARSRKHVMAYYPDVVARLGGFPERLKPLARSPKLDLSGGFLSYAELNEQIGTYRLALFNPSAYLREEYAHLYQDEQVRNFSQAQREYYLIGMMRVNFLKRLESSVEAFEITMRRTVEKIDALRARIALFREVQAQNTELDLDELTTLSADDEELQDAFQVGKNLVFNMAHLKIDEWDAQLKDDRNELELMHSYAVDVTPAKDGKLAALKELILDKAQSPTTNRHGEPNRKVIVFTAFADTADYLYAQLQPWASADLDLHCAKVVGGTGGDATTLGRAEFNHILTNFAPRAKRRAHIPSLPQDEEIDLLIATDCISEGQNLQDCDMVINYDIHWNPVRIIQRFGRIDRINSPNESVQLVNFWPTPNLDQYINLRTRVESRMALVDVTATGSDNLLELNELEETIAQELSYRDQQLLRLRDEVLDLEDFNESVALNEFTLDDFRTDLLRFIERNRELLENAPLGLYAVVPHDPDYPEVAPGVIFCLRHKRGGVDNETVNPLHPHYLVYIREDGEVRYRFTQPKQILDIYRLLCSDQTKAHEQLCTLFDARTDNGRDMRKYDALLKDAARSITRTFRKRNAQNLLSGRGGQLVRQLDAVRDASDFDLISWLVILQDS